MKYTFDGVIVYSTASKSKYVPFNLSKEEDRNFLRGKWIKKKDTSLLGKEFCITSFEQVEKNKKRFWCVFANRELLTSKMLTNDYTFIDGTPITKERRN